MLAILSKGYKYIMDNHDIDNSHYLPTIRNMMCLVAFTYNICHVILHY